MQCFKFIIILILLTPLISIYIDPAHAEGLIQSMDPVTFEQITEYGFMYETTTVRSSFTFNPNGSVFMVDDRGSKFNLPPPSFQPKGAYTTSLLTNSTHAIHVFDVQNGTLKLWIIYKMEGKGKVKVTLNGTTTDEDSEIEQEFENPKSLPLHETTTSYTIGFITYNWADLEGETYFEAYANRLKIKFDSSFYLDPSIVSSAGNDDATKSSFQRHLWKAQGYFWSFYSDGTNMVYRSSLDGGTWGDPHTIQTCDKGYYFDIWANSTHLDYALHYDGLRYRKGQFGTNGLIGWVTSETVIISGSGGVQSPSISWDSNSYSYIVYKSVNDLKIVKNSQVDGSWSNATGYPMTISEQSSTYLIGGIVSLTSNKMYLAYTNTSVSIIAKKPMYGSLFNGTSWGTIEQCSTSNVNLNSGFSMVADDDDVHLVFGQYSSVSDRGKIVYLKRTYGSGWGSETVFDDLYRHFPTISKADASAKGQYYIFSIGADENAKRIFWRWFNSSWTDEETLIEGVNLAQQSLSAMYQHSNSELGIIYTTQASPNYVKFYKIGTLPDTPWQEHGASDQSIDSQDRQDFEDFKEPIIVPEWGYWLIGGGLALVGVMAILSQQSSKSRRKIRGSIKSRSTKRVKNLKKRDRKGRFA